MQVQATEKMRVLVVDDQPVVREILCSNLENEPDLEIVGTAADGDEAIEAIARLRPDVVLLDIVMRNTDGLTATGIITKRFPETRVLILSGHDSEEYLDRALKAGAHGYVPKNSDTERLVQALHTVHRDRDRVDEGDPSIETPQPDFGASPSDRDARSSSFRAANNGTRGRRGAPGQDRQLLAELQKNYLALQEDVRDLRTRSGALLSRLNKLEKQAARNRSTIAVLAAVVVLLGFIIFLYSPENFSPSLPSQPDF